MAGVSSCHYSHRRLILFGRYPVPGQTKTRLIPALGALGAADLHRRLVEKSLSTILSSGRSIAPVGFCYTGATRSQVLRWLGPQSIRLDSQKGHNLGARMRHAIFDAIDQGCRQVVLVGTDIPHMTADHLAAAFKALNRFDLVLGPSPDGGYWLIGLRQKADLFSEIAWAGPDVLAQTEAVARKLGISSTCITTLNDMDTEADLKDGLPAMSWQRPYLSVIIPTLNEEKTIEAVIQNAQLGACEVIVSDGGSLDRTRAIARACGAKVITSHKSRARQQNVAVESASGRVLLFLHADTLLPRDYGKQVFDTLLDRRVVAGAFHFKSDYDHWGMRIIEKAVRIRSTLFQMPYGDQALFLPKAIFDKIDKFPLVPIAEDLFLVKRLRRLGRIALAPGAALTSARRWRHIGVWRTTLINYLVAIGCMAGVDPQKLAPLYKLWVKS